MKEDIGKVGYLTVHESYVDVGECQRREGLHIESPGFFPDGSPSEFKPAVEHCWGMGALRGHDFYDGGIFMASSQKDTSKVWNALVDSRVPGIVDHHGGCEHLRNLLGEGIALEADELIWMTDLTPHEAIQQKESGIRQFFRVVTPNITHWYKDHSTENPKVPLPPNVIVIEGNKFGDPFDVNKATATFDWLTLQDEDMTAKKDFKATESIIDPKDLFKTGVHEGKYRQSDELGVPTHMSDGKPIKKQERKKLLRGLEQYRKKIARVIRKKKYNKEPPKVADGNDVDEQTNITKKEVSSENVSPLPDGCLE